MRRSLLKTCFLLLALCSFSACKPRRISLVLAADPDYIAIANELAVAWNRDIPGMAARVADSGSQVLALRMLETGEADMAILREEIALALPGLPEASILMESTIHCVALAGTGIERLAGLRNKRVAMGPLDSSRERDARRVLESAGITYNDFYPLRVSSEKAFALLGTREVDALFASESVPCARLKDLAGSMALAMLPLGAACEAALVERYPSYARVRIPAGSYEFLSDALESVASKILLVPGAALDKNTVYKMRKTMYAEARRIGIQSRQYAE